jgi:hypothetical protein
MISELTHAHFIILNTRHRHFSRYRKNNTIFNLFQKNPQQRKTPYSRSVYQDHCATLDSSFTVYKIKRLTLKKLQYTTIYLQSLFSVNYHLLNNKSRAATGVLNHKSRPAIAVLENLSVILRPAICAGDRRCSPQPSSQWPHDPNPRSMTPCSSKEKLEKLREAPHMQWLLEANN